MVYFTVKKEAVPMRPSPDKIIGLKDDEIFTFGSNLSGHHGKGAAQQAMAWGAKWGQASGLQGRTYAIPTKDHTITHTLPLWKIKVYVDRFTAFAESTPHLTYLVTEIGCGLAGLRPKEVAPLFLKASMLSNVRLPARFIRILEA